MNKNSLPDELIEIGFRGLFLKGEDSEAARIWKGGETRAELGQVIVSQENPLLAKFLAGEVLRHYNVAPSPETYPILAEAYAFALWQTSFENGNDGNLNGNLWGLLYEEGDAGYLGQRFLFFGEDAIPPLKRLLSNDSGLILYEGSSEAVVGNAYRYRIKDFAAYYLAQITGIPIEFHKDHKLRDQEIAHFLEELNAQ